MSDEQSQSRSDSTLPPEIQRDRDVERFAKEAKLPPYMWDTLGGLSALARFMDAVRAASRSRSRSAKNFMDVTAEEYINFHSMDSKMLAGCGNVVRESVALDIAKRCDEAEAKLRATVSETAKPMGWIACKEQLPVKPNTVPYVPVLFVVPSEENMVCAGRFHGKARRLPWRSLQGSPYRFAEVSHWMPLPEAPK